MSTAAARPPHTLLCDTTLLSPARETKTRQKARHGNMGAFCMQGLLHGDSKGRGSHIPAVPETHGQDTSGPTAWLPANNMGNC